MTLPWNLMASALLGAWIIAAPWLLGGAAGFARWNDLLVGAAIVALPLPRGSVSERYGAWDRYIV
ncbi:MAG: SPW repeat protein [Armatimonadetes bacterium]|nr:SPW repeat protein [Armatimonadota bacterium]